MKMIPFAEQISWKTVITYVLALLVVVYMVAPFGWLVVSSFMTEAEANSVPTHFLPQNPTLDNYLVFLFPQTYGAQVGGSHQTTTRGAVAGRAPERLPRSILNSTIVACIATLINLIFGSMAAYSFTRLRFQGSRTLMISYLITRMVPLIVIIIPIFIVANGLHMTDSLISLSILEAAAALPFTVWILKSYFQTIPRDLEDAARIDRCNWIQMMLKVFLPLAKPGLTSAGICVFIWAWQDFLGALVLTNTMASKTATTVAAEFVSMMDIDRSLLVTAGVLTVLPPIILALLFQRLIVQGLVAGAIKG
jgi:multiple sugar transport system permease protein